MQDRELVVKLVFTTASISSRPALLPWWIAVVVQPRDWLVARPTTSGLQIPCSGTPNQTFQAARVSHFLSYQYHHDHGSVAFHASYAPGTSTRHKRGHGVSRLRDRRSHWSRRGFKSLGRCRSVSSACDRTIAQMETTVGVAICSSDSALAKPLGSWRQSAPRPKGRVARDVESSAVAAWRFWKRTGGKLCLVSQEAQDSTKQKEANWRIFGDTCTAPRAQQREGLSSIIPGSASRRPDCDRKSAAEINALHGCIRGWQTPLRAQ